jgi:hypothetical protein
MREQLKVAYVELSMFQLGVGSSPIGFNLSSVPAPNEREGILEAARLIRENGSQVQRWSAVTNDERDQLVEELKR